MIVKNLKNFNNFQISNNNKKINIILKSILKNILVQNKDFHYKNSTIFYLKNIIFHKIVKMKVKKSNNFNNFQISNNNNNKKKSNMINKIIKII